MASKIRGHGWVTPLPSGAVARCGGPGMCWVCQMEQEVVDLKAALATTTELAATVSREMLAAIGRAERAEAEADDALDALTNLLAVVNIVTLEDPSKHRVANTVAGPALVARQVLDKHGRLELLNRAVQDHLQGEGNIPDGPTDEVD